ncbi:hypothetical protein QYE80_27155 [Pseudomonas tohonis]|nr:hypothetical protein [Pseudomonas tohonis]
MDEIKISLTRWFWDLAVPWARPLWSSVAGIVICLIFLIAGPDQKPPLWWASLWFQLLGLCLSAGALAFSGHGSGVDSPWRVLKSLLGAFPRVGRAKTNHIHLNLHTGIGVTSSMIGTVQPNPALTDSEKIEWLIKAQNDMYVAHQETIQALQANLKAATERYQTIELELRSNYQSISERLERMGQTNFYQIVIGLVMLSIGSILSLFI